jgi:hypothetical protein
MNTRATLALFALLLFIATAPAAEVVFSTASFTGDPVNRQITIRLRTDGQAIATNLVFRTPIVLQPTNGVATASLLPANYQVNISGVAKTFFMPVPDSTNTYNAIDLINQGISMDQPVGAFAAGTNTLFTTNWVAGFPVITIHTSAADGTNDVNVEVEGPLLSSQIANGTLTITAAVQTNGFLPAWADTDPSSYNAPTATTATTATSASHADTATAASTANNATTANTALVANAVAAAVSNAWRVYAESLIPTNSLTAWIDATIGDDATAIMGRDDKPWRNLDVFWSSPWKNTNYVTVQLRRGEYVTGGSLVLRDGWQIIGAGIGATVIRMTNAPGDSVKLWIFNGSNETQTNKYARGFTVSAGGSLAGWGTAAAIASVDLGGLGSMVDYVEVIDMKATTGNESWAIVAPSVYNSLVHRPATAGGGILSAINVRGGSGAGNYVNFDGVTAFPNTTVGMTPSKSGSQLYANRITNVLVGIYVDTVPNVQHMTGIKVFNNDIAANTRNGGGVWWRMSTEPGDVIRDFGIHNNTFRCSTDDAGIILQNAIDGGTTYTGSISNGVISGNIFLSDGNGGRRVYLDGVQDVEVANNPSFGVFVNPNRYTNSTRVNAWNNNDAGDAFAISNGIVRIGALVADIRSGSNGVVTVRRPDGSYTNFLGTTDSARGSALTNANAQATSGDAIFVGPGRYLTTAPLGKSGVTWWFSPGATVTNHTTHMWSDASGGVVCEIRGNANFDSHTGDVFNLTNGSSRVVLTANRVTSTAGTAVPFNLARGSTIVFNVEEYISSDYDVFLGEEAGGVGNYYGYSPRIIGADNVFETSGTLHVSAREITAALDVFNGGVLTGMVSAAKIESTTSVVIRDTIGPNFRLRGSELRGASADGVITLEAGAGITVEDSTLIGSDANTPGVYVDGMDGLVLKNCRIVSGASATYSINDAGSAATVTIIGTLQVNKPIRSTTDVVGGGIVYDTGTGLVSHPEVFLSLDALSQSSATNGQVPVWNTSAGRWEPGNAAPGSVGTNNVVVEEFNGLIDSRIDEQTSHPTNFFGNPVEGGVLNAAAFGGLTNLMSHAIGWRRQEPTSAATNLVVSLTNAISVSIVATNNVHLTFSDPRPGAAVGVFIRASGDARSVSWPTNLVTLSTNGFAVSGTNWTVSVPQNRVLYVSAAQHVNTDATNRVIGPVLQP